MSTNPCNSENCPGGNCVGCLNGQINCMDPRCYPNCKNCNTKTSSSNWIIVTIILVLLGVLLVMAFIVGFDLYKKGKKAAEPKNITVNKHVHSIKQAPIVVSSPPPVVISQKVDPTPFVRRYETVSYEPSMKSYINPSDSVNYSVKNDDYIPQITRKEISYDGLNLSMEELPSKSSEFLTREIPCDRR